MADDRADAGAGPLDLDRPRRIHIVGAGGAGMSALAEVLTAMGHRVSGSDAADSPVLARLAGLGVAVSVGHDAAHVGDAEVVAVSTAIRPDNPEVVEAGARGIPVLRRADLLATVSRRRRVAAIAGTHGKTTTSAMLATALGGAGLDPSFLVGGVVAGLGTGARWAGEWLVVEADESDGTFLALAPEVAVVTSVAPDHLDHWGGFDALVEAFGRFVAGARHAVVCADDEVAGGVAGLAPGAVTYGEHEKADYRIVGLELAPAAVRFGVTHDGSLLGQVEVPAPGRHNALNATAAIVAALRMGAPFEAVASALGRYPGVARRFERRGEAGGVTFVDDYGHLPAKVAAAVAAARGGGWRRVVCVFQPHRYTRTAALWRDFATAFDGADVLVVTDVYAAGEDPQPGVSGKLIVDAVLEAHPVQTVAWLPGREDVVSYLRSRLRPGDLCLTLGAGDVTTLPDDLLTGLP